MDDDKSMEPLEIALPPFKPLALKLPTIDQPSPMLAKILTTSYNLLAPGGPVQVYNADTPPLLFKFTAFANIKEKTTTETDIGHLYSGLLTSYTQAAGAALAILSYLMISKQTGMMC